MPTAQPIPNGPTRRKPAVSSLLRCEARRPRSALPGIPDRALARGLVALFAHLGRDRGHVCAGCPIVPGVPDRAMRYPTCEVCRWPAVDVGPVHAWRCAFCRHWNEHGSRRPRSAAVVLQLRRVTQAAHELVGIAIPLVFGYPTPPGTEVWRDVAGNTQSAALRGFVESMRLRRDRRPVYVRGRVAGHHVLLVGGDRSDPYPLGLAEHWADLRSVGRWVTRVSCPCGAPSPCVHAQALYAQVVGVLEARRQDRHRRHGAFHPRRGQGREGGGVR
jgi:ribosomal protein L37AE/L43A